MKKERIEKEKYPKGNRWVILLMYVTVQEKNKLQVYCSANIKALEKKALSNFYRPTYAYCLFGITPGSMIKLRSQNISSNPFHKN